MYEYDPNAYTRTRTLRAETIAWRQKGASSRYCKFALLQAPSHTVYSLVEYMNSNMIVWNIHVIHTSMHSGSKGLRYVFTISLIFLPSQGGYKIYSNSPIFCILSSLLTYPFITLS